MSDKPELNCPTGDACSCKAKIEKLEQEIVELSKLVSTDSLTGLSNYRHFKQALDQEMERSQRSLQPTTLIMLDIDHFKAVNDQWGHEIGNQAIKMVSHCIISGVRKFDITCRYGGEEFAIILPGSDSHTSIRVAERIRQTIESRVLTVTADGQEKSLKLTVSCGLSFYQGNQEISASTLISNADKQLYRAKSQGRNQCCYELPETSEQQVSAAEKSALFTSLKDKSLNE